MVRLLFLLILTTCVCGCRQDNDNASKYFWVTLRGHNHQRIDTIKIFNFKKTRRKDTVALEYESRYGILKYSILPSHDSAFTQSFPKDFDHRYDSIAFIRQIMNTSVQIKNETFKVRTFIADEFLTDGATIHCYEPALGIFAVYAVGWSTIRYLQSYDSVLNKKILLLIRATVPEFYLRGQLAVPAG